MYGDSEVMALSEQVKKDIAKIIRISSEYDMKKPENAGKIIDYSLMNNLMSSEIGHDYINRLTEISNGNASEDTCIFCKTKKSADGVICSECFDKFSSGKVKMYEDNKAESENDSDDIGKGLKVFCQECGEELHSNICSKCKTKRGEGYNYCGCCGNKVPLPEIVKTEKSNNSIAKGRKKINKKIVVAAVIGVLVLIALATGILLINNKPKVKKGNFAENKIRNDEFAEIYQIKLQDYLQEIGTEDVEVQVIPEGTSSDEINRYRIILDGNNAGGMYIKEEDNRVNSLIVMSPMDAEGTSVLMIPAVEAVNPGMDSKAAASILIDTIGIFNKDMQNGGDSSTKNKVDKYSYMYGISDGVYMLRIDSE